LAFESGGSVGDARAQLKAAEQMRKASATEEALKAGELSKEQAETIADAAAVNPDAEQRLLDDAGSKPLKELKDQAGREKAAADPDPDARERRHHRDRSFRSWTGSDGSFQFRGNGTLASGARMREALAPIVDQIINERKKSGHRESKSAYLYDALMRLIDQSTGDPPTGSEPAHGGPSGGGTNGGDPNGGDVGGPGGGSSPSGTGTGTGPGVPGTGPTDDNAPGPNDGELGPNGGGPGADDGASGANDGVSGGSKSAPKVRHRAIIRVDYEALRRGHVEGDEVCEIAGLGPIPIRIALELLGESTLHLVLTKGVDVMNVTYLGRGVNAAQKVALDWSQCLCSNSRCTGNWLQDDHRDDYAGNRVTELRNIDRLCPSCHRLKTYKGWRLVEGTGRRPLVPPTDPRHPNTKARSPTGPAAAEADKPHPKATEPGTTEMFPNN
jgi:hypothetical protein